MQYADFERFAKFQRVKWEGKDALAFVNGTSAMVALASMNIYEVDLLLKCSVQLAFSYSECLGAYREAWDPRLSNLHPQPGHVSLSSWLSQNSDAGWFTQEGHNGRGVFVNKWPQDPYSVRCIPQLLGAVMDQLNQVSTCLETELNTVSDNPNFFPADHEVLHGGNFNGQHAAFASDQLNLQIAYLGIYAEKRISTLCDPKLNHGLTAFLKTGLEGENSGFMGAQVTATALCAELKALYKPFSLETMSTNGHNQDMVSMGTSAAWRGYMMIQHLKSLLCIECMVLQAALIQRASQLKEPLSAQSSSWQAQMAKFIEPLTADRPLGPEIDELSKKLLKIIETYEELPFSASD